MPELTSEELESVLQERNAWRLAAIALFQHVFNNEERDAQTMEELAGLYKKAHDLSFKTYQIPPGGPYPGFGR